MAGNPNIKYEPEGIRNYFRTLKSLAIDRFFPNSEDNDRLYKNLSEDVGRYMVLDTIT